MGWRSHVDPAAKRYEDTIVAGSRSIGKTLQVTLTARHEDAADQIQEDRTKRYQQRAIAVFNSSGYFSQVGTDIQSPDFELVLNVTEKENFNQFLAFLCGFTLLVVPAYDRVDVLAEGAVHTADGTKLGDVRAEESVSVLITLLALPFMPFAFPPVVDAEAAIFKSVLVQMSEIEALAFLGPDPGSLSAAR